MKRACPVDLLLRLGGRLWRVGKGIVEEAGLEIVGRGGGALGVWFGG